MLIEKTTRKIEIDENNDFAINIRETKHIVDSDTGDIIHANISHHRKSILPGDDEKASKEGLSDIANVFWTPEVRAKQKDKK